MRSNLHTAHHLQGSDINIKQTIYHLRRWPGVMNGYLDLFFYAVFFILFVMLVVFQSDVEVANLIDDSIRNNLLQQDDALASVRTHGDFFDYLLKSFDNKLQNFVDGSEPTGGLINTILGGTWYNGDPFTTNEMGMIYNYNKLIGGVLIIQKRGEIEACEYSMYSLFYPTCYSRVKYITADPPLRANGTQEVCGSSVPMMEIDESSADYQQYLDELESSKFGDRTKLNQTDYLNVASSFQYSYKDQGYRVWLSLADGIKANLQQIEQLQELKWLDSKTRHIDLKFIFYNGNFGMFTFAKVSLEFSRFGTFIMSDPSATSVQRNLPGGTTVSIGSINMEPYLTRRDFILLGFEVIFMVWVFFLISAYIKSFLTAIYHRRLHKFFNMWACLDLVNYTCYLMFIVIRIGYIKNIICNPVRVPTNDYNPIFEQLYRTNRDQLSVNFISILIGTLRFFKYYEFQPRLQIVNKTLSASMVHLYHFCLIFGVMLVGYAAIGHLNFGNQSRDFATVPNSIQVMWESLFGAVDLGPTIGNYNEAYINPIMANVFFISWMFFTGMVLMNVFVAILMDGYAAAKEEGKKTAERLGKTAPDAVHEDVIKAVQDISHYIFSGGTYSTTMLLHALEALDEHIPDPEVNEEELRKEMSEIDAEIDRLNKRKNYIEKTLDAPLVEQPCHDVWNKKRCSFDELVGVIHKMYPNLHYDIDDMQHAWSRSVYKVSAGTEEQVDWKTEMLEKYLQQIQAENQRLQSKLSLTT